MKGKKLWSIIGAGIAAIVLTLGVTFSCVDLSPNYKNVPNSATGPSSSDN